MRYQYIRSGAICRVVQGVSVSVKILLSRFKSSNGLVIVSAHSNLYSNLSV